MNRPGASASVGFWLFLSALVLRLIWVVYKSAGQAPTLEFPDEELHWQLARNLVNAGALVSDDGRYAARMPVYPLFLALFAWMGSGGVIVARLASVDRRGDGVARASVRQRGVRSPRGLIAGVLAAVDLYAVFFCNLLLTETLFTLIGVMLTYAAWRMLSHGGEDRRLIVVIAVLGPMAIMTRPSSAGWIALLWIGLGLLAGGRARGLIRVGIFAAACLLLMAPWGIRNRLVVGSFAWLSTNGGVTLYDAQHPAATGAGDQTFLGKIPELEGLNEVAADRWLAAAARDQMWRHPGRVVELAWVKFWRTWSLRPNYEVYRGGLIGWASVAFMLPVLLGALAGPVRMLTTLGTPLARWRRLVLIGVLWLPILYFTFVHCIYIGSLRYRVPVMPFVELSAAAFFFSPARRHEGIRSQARLWTQVTSRT